MNANLIFCRIEMTKNEAKAAGKLNSDAAKELKAYRAEYPNFEIYIKPTAKRKTEFKGLTYTYMEQYIQKCKRDDKQEILAQFVTLTMQEENNDKSSFESLRAASYFDVKEWFLATFPEIKQYRKDHEEKKKAILAGASE